MTKSKQKTKQTKTIQKQQSRSTMCFDSF